jgi:hypothetical protein
MKTSNGDWDLGYFKIWPAPMWEAMTRLNPCEVINSTTPQYGPLLYSIARSIPAFRVLEIGIAEGWSSGFMAWAVKENNTRFTMNGRFYGLDCSDKSRIQVAHDEIELPSTFIQHEKGSVDFLEHRELWPDDWKNADPAGFFDLIFIDGLHQVDYVRREIELVYPLLKGNGSGYLCNHDVYSFMESLWPEIVKQTAPDCQGVEHPRWEHIRFLENYGFGIMRKMEGYDYKKQFWPDGDQTALAIQQGFLNADGTVKK